MSLIFYVSKTSLGLWRRLRVYHHLPHECEGLSSNVEDPHGSQTQHPGRRKRKPVSPALTARSFFLQCLSYRRGSICIIFRWKHFHKCSHSYFSPWIFTQPWPLPFLCLPLADEFATLCGSQRPGFVIDIYTGLPVGESSGCACEHGGGPRFSHCVKSRVGGYTPSFS